MAKERSVRDFIPQNREMLVTVPAEHQTKGGVIIPDGVDIGARGEMNKVVIAGKDCKFAQVGDEIVLNSGKPTVLIFKEGTFAVVRENTIAGVIRPDNPMTSDELIEKQANSKGNKKVLEEEQNGESEIVKP